LLAEFGPVFVTHYPKRFKFFNMRVDRANEDVVEAVDLLLPGVGEALGGSARESDADIVRARLAHSPILTDLPGVRSADFDWYLSILSDAAFDRAGAGLGFERFIQFLLQVDDIRLTQVFPRDAAHLVP
jgi:asparaginyl-tRNA synthetase